MAEHRHFIERVLMAKVKDVLCHRYIVHRFPMRRVSMVAKVLKPASSLSKKIVTVNGF